LRLEQLACQTTVDGKTRGGGQAKSKLLCTRVVFRRPIERKTEWVVVSAHMHHLTAKKEKGFAKAHENWWMELALIIRKCGACLLGGDFNMSALVVPERLQFYGIEAIPLAWYAWTSEDAPDEVKLDSLGLFALGRVPKVRLALNPAAMWEPTCVSHLPRWRSGQGYALASYLGGSNAAKKAFAGPWFFELHPEEHERWMNEQREKFEAGSPDFVSGFFSRSRQKLVSKLMWDHDDALWSRGAHMPLMVFIGLEGHRSDEAKLRRAAKTAAYRPK